MWLFYGQKFKEKSRGPTVLEGKILRENTSRTDPVVTVYKGKKTEPLKLRFHLYINT